MLQMNGRRDRLHRRRSALLQPRVGTQKPIRPFWCVVSELAGGARGSQSGLDKRKKKKKRNVKTFFQLNRSANLRFHLSAGTVPECLIANVECVKLGF